MYYIYVCVHKTVGLKQTGELIVPILYIIRMTKDDIGGTHSTPKGNKKCIQIFWSESLKGRVYLRDLDVDGWKLLNWILKKQGLCGMD
jgi:hypothetical protein